MHTRDKFVKSKCFKPIARADARLLILGSLPGAVSLARRRYYAQPYNAFWRIMGDLFGAAPDLPYQARLRALKEHQVALWDVCGAGCRLGSLDSAIDLATVEANDIGEFLRAHAGVELICFNGRKAKEIFDRKVRQEPAALFERLHYAVLPSTSAAHAGMPYSRKLAEWRHVLNESSKLRLLRQSSPKLVEEAEISTFTPGSLS